MVRIKIKKEYYYGIILSTNGKKSLVRYDIGNNKKTSGWFYTKDIEIINDIDNTNHKLRKTENVRIKCKKCKYETVTEKQEKYGYCPDCMGKKWETIKDEGIW